MLNNILKLFSLLLLVLLSACNSETKTSKNSNESAFISAEQAQLAMQKLVVADDFTFTTKNTIEVRLDLSEYQNQRAYISLYSHYQALNSEDYYPDPTSRVLSGALVGNIFSQSFIGFNNQQQYLLEVWFYDGRNPLQKVLILDADKRLEM